MADEIREITGELVEFMPIDGNKFEVLLDGKSLWRRVRPGVYPPVGIMKELFAASKDECDLKES